MGMIKKPMRISIRTRLVAVYVGIIVVGFTGLTVFAGGQMTSAVRADYEERLQNEIGIVANSLNSWNPLLSRHSNSSGAQAISRSESATLLKPYEDNLNGQLTLYTLPQQSQGPAPANGNVAQQPGSYVPVKVIGPVQHDAAPPPGQSVVENPGPMFFNAPELAAAWRCETILVQRPNAA